MMKPNVFQVLRNYGWVIKTSPPFITKLTAAAPEKLPLEMFGKHDLRHEKNDYWSKPKSRALPEKYLHEDRDQRVAKLVTQTTLHKKVMPFITCL